MASKRPPIELEELTNNLKSSTGQGINAFFSQPRPEQLAPERETRAPQVTPPVRPVPVVPGKRIMRRRHPLDIYEDQYGFLLEYQMNERKHNRLGSMSEFVRNALDEAIENYR